MKRFLSLVKMQLKVNFGLSVLKYRFTVEKKKRMQSILIALAIVVGFGPILAFYTYFMTNMFYAAANYLNNPEIILTMAFIAAQLMVLFFGMFYILGSFYFSQDIDTLVPLPLKPYEVIGSKFAVVMVNEYITAIPILLPPLIIYAIGTGQGIIFWIKCLLLILTAPAIPLILGALFIMLLMRVVNLRKNKDLFAIIGGFLGIVIAVGINLLLQRMPKDAQGDYFINLLQNQAEMINQIGKSFPPSIWATLGLSDNGLRGLGYFALFIGVSALLFGLLLWISNIVFYKALIAGQEVTRKRKTLTETEMNKKYESESKPVSAIIKREWKTLLRTPVYVINGLTGAIMGPLLLIILLFARGSDPCYSSLKHLLSLSYVYLFQLKCFP
jgi:ABC-2 type transport system permease protein